MHWSRCQELRVICWLSSPQTVVFLQLPSSPLFLILLSPLSRFSLSLHCTEPELLVTVALTLCYERIFQVVKWWTFKPVDRSHVPVQTLHQWQQVLQFTSWICPPARWSLWPIRTRLEVVHDRTVPTILGACLLDCEKEDTMASATSSVHLFQWSLGERRKLLWTIHCLEVRLSVQVKSRPKKAT